MMYQVIDIIEPDFGCEGLPDGQELCCEVILKSDNAEMKVKIPDAELYRKAIDVHSFVTYNNGIIEKI